MARSTKKIALRLSLQSGYHRSIVEGVIAYIHKRGPWQIELHGAEPILFSTWEEIADWEGDGLIAAFNHLDQVNMLKKKGLAVVGISNFLAEQPFPTVTFDNAAVGRLAAEHLLTRQVENFAFIGDKQAYFARARFDSFAKRLKEVGCECSALWVKNQPDSQKKASDVRRALAGLEVPVGVFAVNDTAGFQTLEACSALGLSVPDDVAVVAADNDELLCNLAHPSLSSIATDCKKIGFEAAQTLDLLMRGESIPEKNIRIAPEHIVLRNSSDRLAIDDRHVAEVLRYIRNHAGRYIDVSDVLNVVSISRRSLERRFMDHVGRGVYQEINRVHIERARKLLETTDWPITRIARESGFNSTNRFEVAFLKFASMNASTYRATAKTSGPVAS